MAAVWEQELVDRFSVERPELNHLYGTYLEYASDAHTQMVVPRFAQHDTGRVLTPRRFIHLLGVDTDHRFHPIRQHWIVDAFLKEDLKDLSPAEVDQLEVTNLFHDAGEPFCAEGDVRYGLARDEISETTARKQALLGAFGAEKGEVILDKIEPVLQGESPLSPIFKLIERIGYYKTGIRAAKLYHGGLGQWAFDDERRVFGLIAKDVQGHQYPHLQEVQASYRTINALLMTGSGIMKVAAQDPALQEHV